MELPFTIHNWLYLILSLVGLITIVSAIRSKRQADASQSWQATRGTVIESRIEKHTSTDGDGEESTSYTPVVLYKYTILEKEYTGDRINFGAKNTNRNPATQTVTRYKVGAQVMVYYNPDKPGQSVLERSSNSGWLQILLGFALFIAGIYLAVK
jgi:hypothetical protein